MRVLISNDDGVDAPGLKVLAHALAASAEVTVVAPDRDYSGASSSLTLTQPIRVIRSSERCYRVAGTPTDCVHLALSGLLEYEPDIVVSGINNSANLGDDVIYSGTVAAALEGRYCGFPAIAVSLVTKDQSPTHFATAAQAVQTLIERCVAEPLPAGTVLNVNVPDRSWDQVAGFEVTRLGCRHRARPCIPQSDPRGRKMWWVGPAGDAADAGAGTDFDAIARGYVSITPLQVDLTRFKALDSMRDWAGGLADDAVRGGQTA